MGPRGPTNHSHPPCRPDASSRSQHAILAYVTPSSPTSSNSKRRSSCQNSWTLRRWSPGRKLTLHAANPPSAKPPTTGHAGRTSIPCESLAGVAPATPTELHMLTAANTPTTSLRTLPELSLRPRSTPARIIRHGPASFLRSAHRWRLTTARSCVGTFSIARFTGTASERVVVGCDLLVRLERHGLTLEDVAGVDRVPDRVDRSPDGRRTAVDVSTEMMSPTQSLIAAAAMPDSRPARPAGTRPVRRLRSSRRSRLGALSEPAVGVPCSPATDAGGLDARTLSAGRARSGVRRRPLAGSRGRR